MIAVDRAIVEMDGLPRQNGELVFEQPWEARAFGVAVALCREQSIDWELFRSRLIDEIGGWEHEHGSVPSDDWATTSAGEPRSSAWCSSSGRAPSRRWARAARLAHADSQDHDHPREHDHDY